MQHRVPLVHLFHLPFNLLILLPQTVILHPQVFELLPQRLQIRHIMVSLNQCLPLVPTHLRKVSQLLFQLQILVHEM